MKFCNLFYPPRTIGGHILWLAEPFQVVVAIVVPRDTRLPYTGQRLGTASAPISSRGHFARGTRVAVLKRV